MGILSPKSVLMQSTPWSKSPFRHSTYHSTAAGLVKSTRPMPACHRSHCHTSPFFRFNRYPFWAAVLKAAPCCAMYGLIHTQTFLTNPDDFKREICALGSGKRSESKTKSVHVKACTARKKRQLSQHYLEGHVDSQGIGLTFIQKQS